jgi:epoxyqueuosine reductase
MSVPSPTQKLKEKAHELGFELAGSAPAKTPDHYQGFSDWLKQGYAGEMGYLQRRQEERGHPEKLLPGARSVFCVAQSYKPAPEHEALLGKHPVSCYAWGKDYHEVLGEKLKILCDVLCRELIPGAKAKWYVDTGPVLERSFAFAAGLGWIGKNTLLLNRQFGSFLFLGEILTDAQLIFDAPVENLCRTCKLCLEACPTGALEKAGLLIATQCISYLTLEHRSPLPEDISLNGYLAGCDLCQAACPYNAQGPAGRESAYRPGPGILGLTREKASAMTRGEFKELARESALSRVKYAMWKRNAGATMPK